MKKYLIALDLDGTLLPDLYSLTDYSKKIFNKLNELGHDIVITTGRPLRSSKFVYDAFNLKTPLINYNGCLVSYPNENKIIKSVYMKREDVLDIYNKMKGRYNLFFSESYDDIHSNLDGELYRLLMHYSDPNKLHIGDLNDILPEEVHGTLILANSDEDAEVIHNYVNNNFTNVGSRIWAWGPFKNIIELYETTYTKGDAITDVAKLLGYEKDDIIACGDSQNDFEFFSKAGITVSLKNADPRIQKISTYVYDELCENSGMAKFFNEFFKLNIKG